MVEITDDMVEKAAKSLCRSWADRRGDAAFCKNACKDCRQEARAALSAVLPDAIAQARKDALEEAARIAETRHEGWRMPHPDDAGKGEVCDDISACQDIAAAIRAEGGEK